MSGQVMSRESLLERLEHGLDGLETLLEGQRPDSLRRRSAEGKWSAHENLAHLGRYHEVTLERLDLILASTLPRINRYSAENDSEAASWLSMPTGGVLGEMREVRRVLFERCLRLTTSDLERQGVHPLYGSLTLRAWLEFFLVHEGHHLYLCLLRLGEARAYEAALSLKTDPELDSGLDSGSESGSELETESATESSFSSART